MTTSTLRSAWERFWFARSSPLALAAFRVVFAFSLLREVETSRVRSMGALNEGYHWPYVDGIPRLSPAQYEMAHDLQYPLIVSLCLGLATRSAAWGLLLLQGAIFFADRLHFRNHPWFFLTVLAVLACSPAGEALSIRAWRKARRGHASTAHPVTCQRLIQIQVSLIYAFAALHKLKPSFLNGDVLRAQLGLEDTSAAWASLLAVATILAEAGLTWALWWRRTRTAAVTCGVVFHAALASVLGAGAFSLAMIGSYLLFFDHAEWIGRRQGNAAAPHPTAGPPRLGESSVRPTFARTDGSAPAGSAAPSGTRDP